MKKLVVMVLLLTILVGTFLPAAAESPYEGKTLAELQEEIEKILSVMWKTDEWQEVQVPVGVYLVGKDIPSGEWNIRQAHDSAFVYIGNELNATKTSVDDWFEFQYINPRDTPDGWDITLSDGMYIDVEDVVIFSPQTKKTGFIFK